VKLRVEVLVFLVLLLTVTSLATIVRSVAANNNQAPIACFSYSPEVPMPGETIAFDGSASFDQDGWITQYTWNFGDGDITSLSDPITTHAYPSDGSYTVELTVTDNNGATGVASAVIQVRTVVFFRVCYYGTLIPVGAGVEVTCYYYNGSAWAKAPASNTGIEIKYDYMTQPNLASNSTQRYRNPGYTAFILRCDASNIGFDIHPSTWKVYFKFTWSTFVAYWPNDTTRVYSYKHGVAEPHDYLSGHQAYWDPTAAQYVIGSNDIPGHGVSPTESHPIIVGILCPPPAKTYSLTVRTDPAGITPISGEGMYAEGTNVTLTAPQYVNVSANTRYRFSYWDVDGTSKGSGVNPITVQMNANHTATAHYVLQYSVTFAETGLSPDATGTVVTVDSTPKTLIDLPFAKWVDCGNHITYSYTSIVSSSTSGKQYRRSSVAGPSSPITVTGPATVTGNYIAQYLVTLAQTGLDSNATGIIVTVNGTVGVLHSNLPYTLWVDSGSSLTYSYNSPVSSTVSGKRFWLNSVTGPVSPITVSASTTVTGNYVTQYSVTFSQTGLDSTATGTVVTVNESAKTYSDLSFTTWVDSGSSVTYSYNDVVLSSVAGKRFKQVSVTGSTSPITVTNSVTVTGNYKTQYQVTFYQTSVWSDFNGTIVTVDSVNYNYTGLPVPFWWDQNSGHSFSFSSPLVVNGGKKYVWNTTSGLANLQAGTLTITTSGNFTGNYIVQNCITFSQLGVGPDFNGTVLVVDGTQYNVTDLPVCFPWNVGSVHNFAFQSPLIVNANSKQYIWTSTTGLSTLQSGSITVTTYGSVIGNYKTQYYLTLTTSPSGVNSPSGAGWYDTGTYAAISTDAFVDIVPGSSLYRFNGWTTADMAEITDASASTTTVFMDKAKTVTANYVTQYYLTVATSPSGVNSPSGAGWYDTGTYAAISTDAFVDIVPGSSLYRFNGWTTADMAEITDASASTTTVFMDKAKTVTANYVTQYLVTFTQTGLDPSASGTVVTVNGATKTYGQLPYTLWVDSGDTVTYSHSNVSSSTAGKRFILTGVSGPASPITVTSPTTVTGNYNIQYYLTVATSPSGVNSPSGAGWYDTGTYAAISTDAFVDIVPGSSLYRFNGWTTADMAEITDATRSPTSVLMDKAKTVVANYVVQYKITFSQSGVGTDFTGTVVRVDGRDYGVLDLSVSLWWDKDSTHTFAFQSPLVVTSNAKQYVWTSTTGLSTLQSDSMTVSGSGSVIGNYKTQYYLTVNSAYDSPTPTSAWFDSGTPIAASVTSPWSGPAATRYICTGWTGSGSVPPSGSNPTVSFTISQASSITWNWKTQYLLAVLTDPAGLSPQPTRDPTGEASGSWWYDASTNVALTAQSVTGYTFYYWDIDGTSKGNGVNPISVVMNQPHAATAHYTPPITVHISPPSATIYLGSSVPFTSTVAGGTPSYSYQWYMNNNPIAGATSSSWISTPMASGTYFVYLIVTDANHVTGQSETARITVSALPVGGYSISLTKQNSPSHIAAYTALIALFGAILSLAKRKRK